MRTIALLLAFVFSAATPVPHRHTVNPDDVNCALPEVVPALAGNSRIVQWWDAAAMAEDPLKARVNTSRTNVHDPIHFPLETATPVQFPVEGGGKALFDAAHQTALLCSDSGDGEGYTLLLTADAPPAPQGVKRSDLANLRTSLGIRLGSSIASVMKIYGRTTPLHSGNLAIISYEHRERKTEQRLHDKVTSTFIFRNGRLVTLVRRSFFPV